MDYTSPITLELESRVRQELSPGEKILWMGQPIPKFFNTTTIGPFIFGIPWTIFVFFWMFAALGFKKPDASRGIENFFPLLAIPFLIVGIGLLTSPIWSYKRALKTLYVVTNQRAIILYSGKPVVINSYLRERLKNIRRIERKDGTGDIIFGNGIEEGGGEFSGFLNIRDPQTVEKILREMAESKSDEYRI
ncbi:MAG TPA: hypothetical protein PLQ41_04975 [bacterium]|nr:hypothetical protein [bacterium]HPP30548.1 hypothetical protein [bacterium]